MLSKITFVVLPTLPFRLDLTVWTARRRSGNAVDRWDGHVYRRVLVLHGTPVEIAVEQAGSRLHVCATGAGRLPRDAKTPGDLDARAHARAPGGSDGL